MLCKVRTLFIYFLLFFTSCENSDHRQNFSKREVVSDKILSNDEALRIFFKSNGVLSFSQTSENVNKKIVILNSDESLYSVIDISLDKIIFSTDTFSISDFINNDLLKEKYGFYPKEFFPDQQIIQFEYISLVDNYAEIFINKQKNIRKKILLCDSDFDIEDWEEHFIGCMIDFDPRENPIRESIHLYSKSMNYENSDEEYVFIISEISGDWIKLSCIEACDYSCSANKRYDGWIKWRKENYLLIRLLYSC